MTVPGADALLAGADAAGVCPAVRARLERRRATADAVARAAARGSHLAADLLLRMLRGLRER